MSLPTGTVTFLFTDIEGSTRLLRELGAGYPAALGEHRRALRAAFGRHGGVEVDTQGDAFFVAFERAADALAAADGGQIVLSAAVRDALGEDAALRDLGLHRLKDLLEPERLYQAGDGEFP